ncbi:tetratricopeptide repeat protein [Arenibacter sp. GZD96]|uniref:tetratricopeptide repeat protein n=1 Tax=Aurantibrevibacter litoralis TaxID=3106030 RepID=UPI002AFE1963|nr:tetratricopeptide repeat protein [Arenibacter sp. GZD-96]MEA1786496.1 tetratricopeptide repeat protein [Arenibacter sp. GZD-96]
MKLLLFFIAFSVAQSAFSQDDFLAKHYFNDGDFKKAVVFYEKLAEKNPRRTDYLENLISCYQQLERYTDAEAWLQKKTAEKNTLPTWYIHLGYNYMLQKQPELANLNYDKAIRAIEENPNFGYAIGFQFQKYTLLDYAIKAYATAMDLNPQLDYNFQMARIYGEQGNIEKMYEAYLRLIAEDRTPQSNVLRSINDFVTEDAENENNIKLKKLLLKNAQRNPDLIWNELLSWLFVKQKDFGNAFIQEKAIYKRDPDNALLRMEALGEMAMDANENQAARTIFTYIQANCSDMELALKSQLHIIDIDLLDADPKKLNDLQKTFESLMDMYGYQPKTVVLQIAYAHFLTFKRDAPEKAIAILKRGLELPLSKFGEASLKMGLGDILVYDQKFNQALIYFSQVQKDLKNDVLGQNARFKVAQTSFYKGDFDWALTQLKVLRSSTSQLIANDAMDLSLVISDNSQEDSTQTALKKYARADLLAYQNKTREAISLLDEILIAHKGEKIEDEALLKQAQLLESLKDYKTAAFNYIKIINFYGHDILADDAYFALAELYRTVFNEPEKAMEHYEKIIYNYQDSYFFPEARRNFRRLRGDAIN